MISVRPHMKYKHYKVKSGAFTSAKIQIMVIWVMLSPLETCCPHFHTVRPTPRKWSSETLINHLPFYGVVTQNRAIYKFKRQLLFSRLVYPTSYLIRNDLHMV
jgi:hypothetical protein